MRGALSKSVTSEKLASAKAVYEALAREAPLIVLREILEAVLGLKCSRFQISRAGLDRLDILSRKLGFGLDVGSVKVIPAEASFGSGWSDSLGATVKLDDPRGLFTAYVASSTRVAERARAVEEGGDDDRFGEMLKIPQCCRNHYLANLRPKVEGNRDILWSLVSLVPIGKVFPAGANVLPQYFGAGLISHYPCSFMCASTRRLSSIRRTHLLSVSQKFATYMAKAQSWTFIVVRSNGLIAVPSTGNRSNLCKPSSRMPSRGLRSVGNISSIAARSDEVAIGRKGEVMFSEGGQTFAVFTRRECRIVNFTEIW